MMRSVDVAIVGAGPAGLVMALLLARSGRSVIVFEQNRTFERDYRGEGIQPGTRRIFADLGLRPGIEALDHGSPRGLLARIDGKESAYDFAAFVGGDPLARPIFVPQPRLLAILAEAASRASATIEMGCAFRSLRRAQDRVCGLDVACAGRVSSLSARLVIACDGRFSAVRRAAGIGVRAAAVPYDLLWFSARAPTEANDLVYLQVDGPHVTIAFPSRERMMQIGWLVPKASARPSPAELRRRAPREAADVLGRELSGGEGVALLPIASGMIERWSQPGLLFIGDAAHPMSPVAAQGINVAVQDAVVAARTIVPALDDAAALAEALAAFERLRAGSVRRIARQQNAVPAALRRFGPGRTLRCAAGVASLLQRARIFGALGRPLLDRFLWGDPPIRADSGPWIVGAKDSRTKSR